MWESIRDWAFREIREVTRAPTAFSLVLIGGLVLGWWGARQFYSERIAVLEQCVALNGSATDSKNPELVLTFLDGRPVDGSTVVISDPNDPFIRIPDGFQIRNIGGRATAVPVTVKLSFSSAVESVPKPWDSGIIRPNSPPREIWWAPTHIVPSGFVIQFQTTNGAILSPTEQWATNKFVGGIPRDDQSRPILPVSALVQVFYGAQQPLEAKFVIR